MKRCFLTFVALLLSVIAALAQEPLRIAFVTDLHIGRKGTTEPLVSCIDDINALDSIDFVLVGGDLTNLGSDDEILAAKQMLDKLNRPYWVVSGNHDSRWSESGCNTFVKTFGYEQFEFEAGGYRFIGCNCGPDMRMSPALVPRSSMDWVKSLEKGRPVIFINHYTIDDEMLNWFEIRRELIRLDCRVAIAGHGHRNRAYDYFGLPGMMGRASMREGGRNPGYNIITIKDGVFTSAERNLAPEGSVTLEPWFARELSPVTDTLKYDADGFPEGYRYFTYSRNRKYPQVEVRWEKTEDANIGSGFVADGTRAWYTTASGKVACMELADGKQVWSVNLPGKVYATPALQGNILVVSCTDGGIYAFDAASGRQVWVHMTDKGIVASPVIFGKYVYVGGSDGKFRALRLSDGRQQWVYEKVVGFCETGPYVDKTQVIFTTWARKVYSLDPRNGTLQWVWSNRGSIFNSPGSCVPCKSGDRVFVSCPDRRTYCLDTWTGNLLYFADCGRDAIALSADSKCLYAKSIDGTVCAMPTQIRLSEINGVLSEKSPSRKTWIPDVPVLEPEKYLWKVRSPFRRDIGSSALCVCENQLIVPADKGAIHAFDRTTGRFQWSHKVGLGLVNPVTAWLENGKVCILTSTMDGKIKLLEVTEQK